MFSNNVTDITNKKILGILGSMPLVQEFSFLLKTRTRLQKMAFSDTWLGSLRRIGLGQDKH